MSSAATQGLRRRLRRVERRRNAASLGLMAPSVLFLTVVFAVPILLMLNRAIQNPEIVGAFPRTSAMIERWDGEGLPSESLIATFAEEMRTAREERRLSQAGRRLNYEIPGYRGLLRNTAYALPAKAEGGSWRKTLVALDPRWGETRFWARIKQNTDPYTFDYLLAALDLEWGAEGGVAFVSAEEAIFLDAYARTLWMAFVITAACLVMGYPLAFMMANSSGTARNLLLVLVLLPLWTSLLVRTAAWMVLLPRNGPINELLQWAGLIEAPLGMLQNRFAVYVGMIHILLPFMVMPIYAVMRGVPASHMQAAASLGAGPLRAFARVYLPQTTPGVAAGCLLVFILAIGFYITPALLGGADDQMISYFIAFYTNETLNWGLASALGVILLTMIFVLYAFFTRLIGPARIQTA